MQFVDKLNFKKLRRFYDEQRESGLEPNRTKFPGREKGFKFGGEELVVADGTSIKETGRYKPEFVDRNGNSENRSIESESRDGQNQRGNKPSRFNPI